MDTAPVDQASLSGFGCSWHNLRMPLIQVLNASPASTEKKRQLLAALTATYAEVMEIRPDTIRVVLHELPRENWSVAGVTLADSGQNEAT
ncbi:tautomerase family protein [Arthrobacter sp. UYEF20]|uniref:tautomerase family protein n=1 Tax=Arthrobacter sp. UYEF20 TaxID=1756363 RepID=UPI00339342DB